MTDIDLDKVYKFFSSGLPSYFVKTAEVDSTASSIIMDSKESSAITLLVAVRRMYGIDAFFWEPETLWSTFEQDGINLDDLKKEKIQAAITLLRNPAFYWDSLVFQRTVQALNGVHYNAESLQECHAIHMAWAVYESKLIKAAEPDGNVEIEFDDDVQQYVAVCLIRDGLVYPPDELCFVADNMELMLPKESADFIREVKNSWNHIPKDALRERHFTENALGIQLAKLAASYLYVQDKTKEMMTDVLAIEPVTSA